MQNFPLNYLRLRRDEAGMSLAELAALIGQKSLTAVGRYESGDRVPSLEAGLGLELVFGHRLHALFPDYYHQIEDAVIARAQALHAALGDKMDPASVAKRALLESMPQRAIGNPQGA